MRMIPSKNMGSVSELTVLADVRPELCEIRSTMTHGTRLRILLRTLYGIRRAAVEESVEGRLPGPLEALEFLHFVRFALLDNDTKFLLGVTFDGAWEPYIRAIAERAGPLLDVIFCHTVDYNAHASDKGYLRFSQWVRAHQVEADFFFADSPGTTAKDVRLLADFHQRMMGETRFAPPTAGPDDVRRGIKALHQLYGLDAYFPAEHEKNFLRRTAQMILSPVIDGIKARFDEYEAFGTGQQRVHARQMDWIRRQDEAPGAPVDPVAVPWPPIPPRDPLTTEPEPLNDVQGNILTGYDGMTHGATLLMQVTDLARAQRFLRALELTREGDDVPEVTCNLGFTHRGLARLGLPEEDLERLPFEFRQGMEQRAGWLGDLGVNHPSRWDLPLRNWPVDCPEKDLRVRLSSVDFVIQLQTSVEDGTDDHAVFGKSHPLYATIEAHYADEGGLGVRILAVEATRHVGVAETRGRRWGMEHFGFLDGVSQPAVEHLADDATPARDRIALGELLLGYGDDKDGVEAACAPGFLRNGSFLALRKLSQDVGRFCEIIDAHAASFPGLAAAMMGRPLARSMSGRALSAEETDPLVGAAPEGVGPLLDYDFDRDPEASDPASPTRGAGDATADSHVRRSNPRNDPPDRNDRVRNRLQAPLPRIARRGMSYGSDYSPATAGQERGQLFACFNASLADQFEVVQRWLSGANSSGVVGLRSDPFMGVPKPGQHKHFALFDDDGRVIESTKVDLGPTPLVQLKWGLYLFTPAPSAMATLTGVDPVALAIADRASEADVREGEAVIGRMERLLEVERARDPERAHFVMALRWKALIEDLSARETMRKVWAAIRARGGALETPYGVLVGSREQIARIFAHRHDYSVSGYWARMRDSLGEHYLGMDPEPDAMAPHANAPARVQQDRFVAVVDRDRYAREATLANDWISRIDEQAAFDHAYAEAKKVLHVMVWAGAPMEVDVPITPDSTVVDVGRLVDQTVASMCTKWFDLPVPHRPDVMQYGVEPPARAHNPDHFKSTARYIFSPNPTAFVQKDGQDKGTELLEGATRYVGEVLAGETDPPEGTLLAALLGAREDLIASGIPVRGLAKFCAGILLGTIHGFVGPVGGSLTSLLNEWIKSRELWRQQLTLLRAFPDPTTPLRWDDVAPLVLADVEEGMRIQPFPYVLHRLPVRDVVLRQKPLARGDRAGGPPAAEHDLTIEAGTKIVLGMVSAAHDSTRPTGDDDMPIGDLLFGGAYPRPGARYGRDKTGLHACPGKAIGMGTILGVLAALLQHGNLRRIAPLKLELTPFAPFAQRVGEGQDLLRLKWAAQVAEGEAAETEREARRRTNAQAAAEAEA
ncbi:MAG: hypothetical protein AAGC67_17915, partial [Myxococcota bacterium]